MMTNLSKLVFLLFALALTSFFLILTQTTIYAELSPPKGKVEDPDPFPKLKYPCDSPGLEREFHSLRPYQAAPCAGAALAKFCSNDLIFIEEFQMARQGECQPKLETGSFPCDPEYHINEHDLYIELSGSELPILGNTEQVKNSQGGTEEFDDAQKVNEYASWYLSGVNSRAEYGEPTDDQVINFSGPVNKLLPSIIQDAERIKSIYKTIDEESVMDDTGTGEDGSVTEATKQVENHDQVVVCSDLLGKAVPCYKGNEHRLSEWLKSLSLARSVTNMDNGVINGIIGGLLGIPGVVATETIDQALENLNLGDAWNKRFPPLPWDDGTGKPFENKTKYLKAYYEWRGKSCFIFPILGLKCFENYFVRNKWADLYHYIPLSSTADKKGSNYIKGDGPSIQGGGATVVENQEYTSYSGAPLYFAHTQEVKELSELLNKTYKYNGFEDVPYQTLKDVEKIKKGTIRVNGEKKEEDDCSLLNVRVNQGDNLFAGDKGGPYELWVRDVEYDIVQVQCDEVYEWEPAGCSPKFDPDCTLIQSFTCPAYIELKMRTGTKTPNANEIFTETVAGTGSTLRKMFPRVGDNTPINCIADIPTLTDVYYDPTESETPQGPGADISFRVKDVPADGAGSTTNQLAFPHIGSVYEYFLKGIQTALRPKGYGSPIENGICKPDDALASGDCRFDMDLANKGINDASQKYNVPSEILRAIFEWESGPYIADPDSYQCEEENSAGAIGIGQFKSETVRFLTCGEEFMDKNDVGMCKQTEGKLSRCSIQDSFELMARLLLYQAHKLNNCQATGSLTLANKAEWWAAVCGYHGGFTAAGGDATVLMNYQNSISASERPIGRNMTYCDAICHRMGQCPSYPNLP